MRPFELTLAAKADLRDIALFTQLRGGVKPRNIYLKQIDEEFWLLAENPNIGRTCDDIRACYRTFPQGSQVIFYQQIGSHHMKVIRILQKNFDVTPTFGA